MDTLQSLPENFRLSASFSIKDSGMLLKMNIAGFLLLILFGWLFMAAASILRPEDAATFLVVQWTGVEGLWSVAIVLVLIFATIVLHEAIHGLGFMLLAKARPIFAFRGVYAYAAAPGYYIPRNPYLVIALAPLVVISLAGVVLMAFVHPVWIAPLVLVCVVNSSGAVGDLWVAWLLLRHPAEALAQDRGDEIEIYAPTGHGLSNDSY
ncbi:MAG: DUF3267 domain-containing protein [Bellilinea sp.]